MAIYLDDVIQNGKKAICETLGISLEDIPLKRKKEFQFPVVNEDGNLIFKKRVGGKPEFNVFVPKLGREVKVRYANSQRKDRDNNFSYEPKSLFLETLEAGKAVVQDDNEFIIHFLNPNLCEQSPFRKPNSSFVYSFIDGDLTAKTENDRDEERIMALSIILGQTSWPVKKLRMLAKGMAISGVDDMTDEVVKKTLRKIAFDEPKMFINKAESREVIFSGKIQEAVDRNILNIQTKNGMRRWYLTNEEILPLSFGTNDRAELDNFLSSNWHLFADGIQNALDKKTVSSSLASPEMDRFFESEKPVLVENASQRSNSLMEQFEELKKDDEKFQKIKKYAAMNREDPSLHHKTRDAYDANIEAINLYKEASKLD